MTINPVSHLERWGFVFLLEEYSKNSIMNGFKNFQSHGRVKKNGTKHPREKGRD